MAISSNTTGLRPGVCTSTSRPSSPYEGQMIYETDTDLTYVWGGSAWQQVSGGTAVGNSGLVYVAGTSITNVSSFFVTGFSSIYSVYRLVLRLSRTSGAGGLSVTADFRNATQAYSTNYYGAGWRVNYLGTSTAISTRNNGANIEVATLFDQSAVGHSIMDISGFNTTSSRAIVTGQRYEPADTAMTSFGYENASTSIVLDRMLISCSANMSGSWVLYGYRN